MIRPLIPTIKLRWPKMGFLSNKTALITGGTSGIGLATAKRFLDEGAKVLVTARREEAAHSFNETYGKDAKAIVADAVSPQTNGIVLEEAGSFLGHIDILFLNAGIGVFKPFEQWNEKDFDQIININLKSPFFTIQSLLPLIRNGASIIFNGSSASSSGMKGNTVYGATKAGLRLFSRVLAHELAEKQIRVNTLSPGPIQTPIWSKMGLPEEQVRQLGASIVEQVPLSRFGTAEEMASVALFLASDQSSFVTGIELFADGGVGQI